MNRLHCGAAIALACVSVLPAPAARAGFVNFESQHVHPIALSPDGEQLAVVNTPDARVSVFNVDASGNLTLAYEVPVGLEPVSLAFGPAKTLWVVNHLSDTVSIVDLTTRRVVQTVQTGDEPTDILFTANPTATPLPIGDPLPIELTRQWAWVCVSQENRVQVFDTANATAGAVHSIAIAGSDPRAMTYDRARAAVYVAVFESGNRTTLVPRDIRANPAGPWGGQLHPYLPQLDPAVNLPPEFMPNNGVIVKWNGTDWVDEGDGNAIGVWTSLVPWQVADTDVVRIGVNANPAVTSSYTDVGTLLFDLAVEPGTGRVYVTNTEAHNEIFFEPKLNGKAVDNRIARLDPASGIVEIQDANLNQSGEERVSQPGQLAVRASDGRVFYTAIGGARIGVGDASLTQSRLPYREGGTGIVLGGGGTRLYVVNRFTNDVSVLDAATGTVLQEVAIGKSGFDPTPDVVLDGRRFLYTGAQSQNHDQACASCHPFATMDNVAWDLGDPQGEIDIISLPEGPFGFHPLKGPMTTQSLRGLENTGRLHWRGDRADFIHFNGAFISLLGAPDSLSTNDMKKFSDFIMTVDYPPNPLIPLDNTLSGDALVGFDLFNREGVPGELFCAGCHTLDAQGSMGTGGALMVLAGTLGNQTLKVPQLRNLYEKSGFDDLSGATVNQRGFGMLHDGGVPGIQGFVELPAARLETPAEQVPMVAYLSTFPTGMAGGVGKQWTVRGPSAPVLASTLPVLEQQATTGNLDLIVKGVRGGVDRGYVFVSGAGAYRSDSASDPLLTAGQLFGGMTASDALTFTGVPPTCGQRLGVDRDEDGWMDFDETTYGSDPADAGSVPNVSGAQEDGARAPARTRIAGIAPNPFNPQTEVRFTIAATEHVTVSVFGADGRLVKRLSRSWLTPGEYTVRWDGTNVAGQRVASGIYLVTLDTSRGRDTRKVTLAK